MPVGALRAALKLYLVRWRIEGTPPLHADKLPARISRETVRQFDRRCARALESLSAGRERRSAGSPPRPFGCSSFPGYVTPGFSRSWTIGRWRRGTGGCRFSGRGGFASGHIKEKLNLKNSAEVLRFAIQNSPDAR